MTISIGARLDESLVEEMDSLIDSSSEYKDRTQVITLALEKFLEEKGAIQNERKSRKPIPDNFPTLDNLKHYDLEKKVKIGLKYSFPDNYSVVPVETADQLLYMISKYTGIFKAPFFVGKWTEFSAYQHGYVRVHYYLFNHETAFSYVHDVKLPKCPICGSNRIFMMNDGSFRCNDPLGYDKTCNFVLPNPSDYSCAMEELARMHLRDVIKANTPMVKQLVWVETDVFPYMILLIEKTEHLKVTAVNEAKNRTDIEKKNAVYFDVKRDLTLERFNVDLDDLECPCCGGKVVKEGGVFKCATTGNIIDPVDAVPSELV